MKVTPIENIESYLAAIGTLDETDFFRGVGNHAQHKLIPSIGRLGYKNRSVQLQYESSLLTKFKRHAPAYINNKPTGELEWLFIAQHHGLPTRLLDWSYNPLVALFFAVENEEKADAAVYRCYPFSTQTNIQDPFSTNELAWVVPNLDHIRYKHQMGLFTLHCNPAVEDLSIIQEVFVIPQAVREGFRMKLRKIGITKSFLFSDLDSLCYDITKSVQTSLEFPFF